MYPVSALRPHYRASFVFLWFAFVALLLVRCYSCEDCIRPNKLALTFFTSFCFVCLDCFLFVLPVKTVTLLSVLTSLFASFCFLFGFVLLGFFYFYLSFFLFVISPVKTVSLLSVLTSLLEDQELSSPRRILTRYSRTCQKC